MATVRAERSLVHWQIGRRAEARRDIASALRFFEKRRDESSLAFVWNNLGVIHEWGGEPTDALSAYDRGIAYAEPGGDHSRLERLLENKAKLLRNLGREREAEATLVQREKIWPHQ
jgi:tetratricopeptide (TPR) repeat protein